MFPSAGRTSRHPGRAAVLALLACGALSFAVAASAQAAYGTFDRAWGKDVITSGQPGDTGTGFESCTAVADCEAGVGGGSGGELNGPNGVATDAAGNVYVADASNNRIEKFDSSGNFLRAWGKDVASAGPGNTGTGFEVCVAANGDTCQAGTPGSLGGELSAPNGVTTDAAGNVYVADGTNARRIQKFDSSGGFLRAWGKDVITSGQPGDTGTGFEVCTVAADCKVGIAGGLGGELNAPRGIATDAAGNVYVADASNNRIQRFDSSGTFLRAWGKDVITSGQPGDTGTGFEVCTVAADCEAGTLGSLGGELRSPSGVATDAAGNVYVADTTNNRIQKFDSSGTFLRAWGKDVASAGPGNTGTGFEVCGAANGDTCQAGTTGGLGGELNSPRGLATDAAGDVYVADTTNNRIQKFADTPPAFDRAWGKDVITSGQPGDTGTGFESCTVVADCEAGVGGGSGGELNGPNGVATDAAGNVYVADASNNRIEKFDSSGNFLRAWGKDVASAGPGDTGTGFEVCVAANGDTCQAGTPGSLGGELSTPSGVATDAAGNVYVAEGTNARRIQKFDSSGNFLRAWGKDVITSGQPGDTGTGFEVCTVAADCKVGIAGGLGGELNAPRGIATDAAGNVYVADASNNRIQKFDSSGTFLRAWGKDVITSGQPGDTGTGFEVCTVAADCKTGAAGGLGGELNALRGIATDAAGEVHITELHTHRNHEFRPPRDILR